MIQIKVFPEIVLAFRARVVLFGDQKILAFGGLAQDPHFVVIGKGHSILLPDHFLGISTSIWAFIGAGAILTDFDHHDIFHWIPDDQIFTAWAEYMMIGLKVFSVSIIENFEEFGLHSQGVRDTWLIGLQV